MRRYCPDWPPTPSTRPCKSCLPPCSIVRRRPTSSRCCGQITTLQPRPITPNGAVAFGLILIGATMATTGLPSLAIVAVLSMTFAAIEVGAQTGIALRRSIVLVFPLALFMLIVWVGVVGRSPAEIAAGVTGSRSAASLHVALICARLFLIVFTIQLIAARFAQTTPLRFIGALRIPLAFKRLLVFTLSLVETFRHAIDRAHAALVACGLLTRQASTRNLFNSWVLVQTVWLTAITIVVGRLRDKWPIENTLAQLDRALDDGERRSFSRRDLVWLPIALATVI